MVLSHLTRWFARSVDRAARTECPPVVVPALHVPRSARPSESVPAVEVAVSPTADGMVIRVKGEAQVDCVGALLGGLLAPSACRPAVVTLDLSELRSISCLAIGVLVAYRRSVVRTGGQVRLAEDLQPPVQEALSRAELFELFKTTADAGPNCQAGLVPPGISMAW